jgi:hypothetical protein
MLQSPIAAKSRRWVCQKTGRLRALLAWQAGCWQQRQGRRRRPPQHPGTRQAKAAVAEGEGEVVGQGAVCAEMGRDGEGLAHHHNMINCYYHYYYYYVLCIIRTMNCTNTAHVIHLIQHSRFNTIP